METTINQSLVDLIVRACGQRSLSAYGRAINVSTAHLSRIKTGKSSPTKALCLRMADDDYVKNMGISENDFLHAAGYRVEQTEDEQTDDLVSIQNDTIALGIISRHLMEQGYTYKMLQKDQIEEADFTFSVEDQESNNVQWNFVCDFSESELDAHKRSIAYYYILGRIYSFRLSSDKKNNMNSVLIQDEELYADVIEGLDPRLILANVSIVLVDTKKMTITKERHFGPGKLQLKLSTN